jgi:1-acyl-sn-glycerol-3-phosphate acyltransferase
MNPNRKHPPTLLHRLVYALARLVFRLAGWQAKGDLPDLPKFVLIFSPHTSYADNYMLAAVQANYRFEGCWLAAEKLFKNPLMRRFLLYWGARPVDRSASQNLVEHYTNAFAQREHMVLGLAPSGTRKRRNHWKSGFYWIAYGADVPIVCLGIDYATRTLEIGPVIEPCGDIYADMEIIQDFYAGKVGRRPERMTPVRVSPDIDVSLYIPRKAS